MLKRFERDDEVSEVVDWKTVVDVAVELTQRYNSDGIRPTLRQLHYRLASLRVGGYVNTNQCYKTLSERLVKARKSGDLSWDAIADHVRYRYWFKPRGLVPDLKELVEQMVSSVGEDPWESMGLMVIVRLEKDALAELILNAVANYYVPLCISRGYTSWTFVHDNLDLLRGDGLEKVVLYLGGHDPSGLDIECFTMDAMRSFGCEFELRRVALTYEQVKRYGLLPNPTKKANSRAKGYVAKYGDECWELDAIEPMELQKVVASAVEGYVDWGLWKRVKAENAERRKRLKEELMKRLGL